MDRKDCSPTDAVSLIKPRQTDGVVDHHRDVVTQENDE